MAVRADGESRRLVELKAVDGAYPLFGAVELEGTSDIEAALAALQPDLFGAAVSPRLMTRLDLEIGDEFKIGEARLQVTSILVATPDRSNQGFELGPPVLISTDAMEATDLLQPGSLTRFHYRADLADQTDVGALDSQRQRGVSGRRMAHPVH